MFARRRKARHAPSPARTPRRTRFPFPLSPSPCPTNGPTRRSSPRWRNAWRCSRLLLRNIDVSKPIRDGQCGSAAVVQLKRVGATAPVEISPPATLNCRMVVKLHQWVETSLQPAARETFNAPVRRLVNASGYTCRNRYGSRAATAKISEHAFANALDVSAIVLADGRNVDVLSNWGQHRTRPARYRRGQGGSRASRPRPPPPPRRRRRKPARISNLNQPMPRRPKSMARTRQ